MCIYKMCYYACTITQCIYIHPCVCVWVQNLYFHTDICILVIAVMGKCV